MAITIDWATQVISVPQADLTFIGGTLYELDTDAFRLTLKGLEDDVEGMPFLDTHRHNTEVTIAGVTFARTIEIINGYTVTFEDLQYAVRLVGSNNNIFDEGIINRNQVSIISTNSAGLIRTDIPTQATRAVMGVAYEPTGTVLKINVHLERLGLTVTSPISCRVDWFGPDDTLVFFVTDSSPDARGNFHIERVESLADNVTYYVDVQVTDAVGTVVNREHSPTVGA